jgi:hypothetical protein
VWQRREYNIGGITKFFYVSMVHETLANMYHLNFALMQHHKYSLTELENMIPWERDLYVTLLKNYLEEQEEKQKHQRA